MDINFIIEVLKDAEDFYKDEELKAIEEAISIIQDYSQIEKRRDIVKNMLSEMRDLTPEERESANKYIKSIYKPTGINIFDIIDEHNGLPIKNKKICSTCKHNPPSKKWPCEDCDISCYDRWESK